MPTCRSAAEPFDLDAFLIELVTLLRSALGKQGLEVAHLKAIGLHPTSFGVANLVASAAQPELSLPSKGRVAEAEVVVNARVAADPAILEKLVRETIDVVCANRKATGTFHSLQSFRPGRPQPTHRYAAAK